VHRDLESLACQFEEAQARMYRLTESVDESGWVTKPKEGAWSIDECVAHLTMTNVRYLPLLVEAIDAAPELPVQLLQPRMHRDPVGWTLSRMMEPPVRFQLPTGAEFEPPGAASRSTTVAAFDAAQARVSTLIRELDGLDPTKIRLTSPFNTKLKYSLYSAFHILAAHERRHLWQAEQVHKALGKMIGA
jgi:hypothetical protein